MKMKRGMSLLVAVTLAVALSGCTPEQRALTGGLAAGAVIGSALNDQTGSAPPPPCYGLRGRAFIECRESLRYRYREPRYSPQSLTPPPPPTCLARNRYGRCIHWNQ